MNSGRFILIDNDAVNNFLCKLYIKRVSPEIEIVDFILAKECFRYLEEAYSNNSPKPTVLFLDIIMPIMSGWDFLENFNLLDQKIKDQITIYILSSSVDSKDIDFSANNKYIKEYLVKPITLKAIETVYKENNFAS
ncbi:response regulator [Cyclobacterium qasimii]|uniref:Two-component response regulator n=2 Tax=Cyclobacterium qasimii TaxID=1350429 RepID=S7WR31_9BACT|nr:response regulator [Cyclobacterium qasimii]EPR66583.1 Two-component response regulator [Cyclobacterium qasimii M12-11B]GEO22777.1 hypothetical protein CQA01_33110 [Cyclobacterium qasimii]